MRGYVNGRAPIQGEASNCRRGPKPRGSVTVEEHEMAWVEYHRQYSQQSARTIADRGGFGYWEITDLLGHEPKTWEPTP